MTFRNKALRFSLLPVALFAFAALAPASAQYWSPGFPPPDYAGRIPPQHIEAMVRSMGFQPVAEPRVRGPLWVTHAVDREGRQVRVLIDGFSGRVIDVLRRPLPPSRVAVVPPPNFPPSTNAPFSDYDDEGPDYDYRDMPQQRPADWPPPRPNMQQGPNVIPHGQRGEDKRTTKAPKAAKKKETKNEKEAALSPEKKAIPSPKSRPEDAPKTDAPKADQPKSSGVPTFVPNPDQLKTGSIPPVQPLEMKKSQPAGSLPPVQPPF